MLLTMSLIVGVSVEVLWVVRYWYWVTLWRERAVASSPQAIIVLASSDEILPHCARPYCFVNTNLLGKILLVQIRSQETRLVCKLRNEIANEYVGGGTKHKF